jgi:hypothetical protein
MGDQLRRSFARAGIRHKGEDLGSAHHELHEVLVVEPLEQPSGYDCGGEWHAGEGAAALLRDELGR